MNQVWLIGRLTRDPDLRYTESNLAVARFSVAVDRMPGRDGQDKGTDFPNVVVFGRQAENCNQYLSKGRKVSILGRIQTGSYTNKEGKKVYTTDVVANRVEFLDWGDNPAQQPPKSGGFSGGGGGSKETPAGFEAIDDDDAFDEVPF